jgi:hypothetical protein
MNLPNGSSTSNPAGHPDVRKVDQPESPTQKTATGYERPTPQQQDSNQHSHPA